MIEEGGREGEREGAKKRKWEREGFGDTPQTTAQVLGEL